MRPKVSVIIPVFNANKTIERCCEALFNQTLDEIEFIFVDDFSTDNSVSLIFKTSKKYPKRTKIFVLQHKQNFGVSAARQTGLAQATGQFIIHCDSDDWPDKNMYEVLYQKAKSESAEIVCCDYFVEFSDRKVYTKFPDQFISRPSFNIGPVEGAVWNKLIHTDLIKRSEARFYQNINLGEDFGFVIPCRIFSHKTAVIHQPLYHYYQENSNSITHNFTNNKILQLIDLTNRLELYLTQKNLLENYKKEICYLKFQAKAPFLMFPEIRNLIFWKSIFTDCYKYIWEYNSPSYVKLVAWLIINHFTYPAKLVLKIRDLVHTLNIK